jgi:tellurite resistance protein
MEALIVVIVIGGVAWWRVRRRLSSPRRPAAPRPTSARRSASPPPLVPHPTAAKPSESSRRATSPAGQSGQSATRWVPLGTPVAVGGLTLPGGIYVGRELGAVVATRRLTEPALVNPELPVDLSGPDLGGNQMGYWPSYSNIPPASRGAYLRWLEAGRPGGAYIGYVFLFFYGIERRVLSDATRSESARNEVPVLLSEVERLLLLYDHEGSFRHYATDFLAIARIAGTPKRVSDFTPPRKRVGWDIPLEVKLVLGAIAASNESLPGEWALAWALTSPEIPLRTPATRCPDEFAQLFLSRYMAANGAGLQLKPGSAKLRLEYRPASASFGGPITLDSGGLPDVTRLAAPIKKLAALVTAVTDELDAYSRYIGRSVDRDSVRAVALLPVELARDRASSSLRALLANVPTQGHVVIATADVAAILGGPATPKLGKRDVTALATLLAAHGVGLEPDVRLGTANFSHQRVVVLWRDEEALASPGDGFAAATVLLHLGVTVSASDGEVSTLEQQQLESRLASSFELPPAGQRRLRAHLRWLLAERPGLAGLRTRVGAIEEAQRNLIARYLVALAGSDGYISPNEVDSLHRVYGVLGLDAAFLHRDLHAMAASSPTPIIEADSDPGDFALPREVLLDDRRLAEVMSSTRQVTEVLNAVFLNEESDSKVSEPTSSEEPDESGLAALDETYAVLVRRLSAQPVWPRAEFEALAAELGLLAAGAIETVNDVAFTVSNAPLLEGYDPIELDGHVLKEILDV